MAYGNLSRKVINVFKDPILQYVYKAGINENMAPRRSRKPDNLFLLSVLKKLNATDREKLIHHLNDGAIGILSESVHNFVNVDIGLPSRKLKELKLRLYPSKRNLNKIASRNTSIKRKREILTQEGGSLGLILSAAIPLITSLISSLKRK